MFGAVLNRLATSVRRALSKYAVGTQEPELAFDFIDNEYITNNSTSNFASAITHSRSGNATMTDGYGPELVTNGGFDSDLSGYTLGNPGTGFGWIWNDGKAVINNAGTDRNLQQSILEVGKSYVVTIEKTAGDLYVYYNSGLSSFQRLNTSTNGRITLYLESVTAAAFVLSSSAIGTTIDNVSVREMPVLKWAPHNLLQYSEQFDNAAWSTLGINLTSVTTDLPTGASGTAYRVQDTDQGLLWQSLSLPVGSKHTVAVWAKRGGSVDNIFGLHINGNLTSPQFTATSEWQLFEFETTIVTAGSRSAGLIDFVGQVYDIIIWGMHLYRSDLGGMVDNPERGDSYVPTALRPFGANLVTNGTFDTDSDWTKGTGWSIGSGVASVDGTQTAVSALAQTITVEAGSVYSFRVNIASIASGNLSLSYANGTGSVSPSAYITYTAIGQMERSFVATASGTVTFNISASSSCVGSVDNAIVRKSTVNPATAAYLPRIGHHVYNGSAWVNEGLLAESEARTNLITQSNEFDGTDWSTGRLTITADSAVSPDGADNAYKLAQASGQTSAGYVNQPKNSTSGNSYVASVYAKAGTNRDYIAFVETMASGSAGYSYVDLTTGTVGTVASAHTVTVQDIGNGWYHVAFQFDCTSSQTGAVCSFRPIETDSSLTVTDDQGFIYVYGAMLEVGATPSSYIPTDSATVTRAAETFTIPSANLPWPSPVYTGSELVTSGTFDDASALDDWSVEGDVSTTLSVDNQRLKINAPTTFDGAKQTLTTVVGKVYEIKVDYELGTSTRAGLRLFGTSTTQATASSGTITLIETATLTNPELKLTSGSSSGTVFFDNISVREINPLSVSIAMDGRVSYADEDTAANVQPVFWQLDGNNYIRHRIDTRSSDTGQVQFLQAESGQVDLKSSAADLFSPDILIPYSIASRHGSTFINGAVDGVALTEDTTPTALPDLSAQDLNLAQIYMGTIGTFRVWDRDLGDTGIVEATNPSLEPSLSLTFEGTGTNSFIVNDWSE